MQCAQTLWLYVFGTTKNWVAKFLSEELLKRRVNDCYGTVNARFMQGLLQLFFIFIG